MLAVAPDDCMVDAHTHKAFVDWNMSSYF